MIVIGGETGSGKSMFASFLSRALDNCSVIEGDFFMKSVFCEKERELLEALGCLSYGNDGHIMARSFYSCRADFDKTISIVAPCMDMHIWEEAQRKDVSKPLIVEWSHIHQLSVWRKAEWRFRVTARDEIKIDRLLWRDEDTVQRQSMENRKRVQSKLVAGKITDTENDVIIVENNGTVADLLRTAEKYAEIIRTGKKYFFLTGPHGCGKTYLSRQLASERDDIILFDCGPEMRQLYRDSGGAGRLRDWIEENNQKNGALYTEKQVVNRLEQKLRLRDCRIVIIIGVRSMGHIRIFCNQLGIPRVKIIYVECEPELRKQQIEMRSGQPISEEKFRKMDEHDSWMGLEKVRDYVNLHSETCRVIRNSGTNTEIFLNMLSDILNEK